VPGQPARGGELAAAVAEKTKLLSHRAPDRTFNVGRRTEEMGAVSEIGKDFRMEIRSTRGEKSTAMMLSRW
jgi:hypothetical protein